jgi:hypothetical protein
MIDTVAGAVVALVAATLIAYPVATVAAAILAHERSPFGYSPAREARRGVIAAPLDLRLIGGHVGEGSVREALAREALVQRQWTHPIGDRIERRALARVIGLTPERP